MTPSPVRAGPDAPRVAMHVTGPVATVDARHTDLIAPGLESGRLVWGGRHGSVPGRRVRQWHGRRTGATYTFPAKLCVHLAGWLRGHGVDTEIRGPGLRLPTGWGAAPDRLRMLLGTPRRAAVGGVIDPDCRCHPRDLVPQLVALYPGVRVVVAVRNRGLIASWQEHLAAAIPDRPVVGVREEHRLWPARDAVLVCSLSALDRLVRAEDFGAVVVPDVSPLVARPSSELMQSSGARWWVPPYPVLRDPTVPAYGLLGRSSEQLSDAEALTLLSYFGAVVRPPRSGPVVSVRAVDVRPTADLPNDLLALKRAVWADPGRNAYVADLAIRAAADGADAVVVLAASTSHADQLAPLLPGWECMADDAPGPLPVRAVLTEGRLARGGRLAGTVIDARGWGPLEPTHLEPGAEITIVDVPAAGHPDLDRRTAGRATRYRDNGWATVPATGPDLT